ncbi:protein of unassigned function [Methylobacterium oryzae CBMB20]|uniref:Protein of unassigned function n=1 Tax=Methylobacterium oryzae CBMB20 TaxID=693986 RepID=A0A089NRW3_9HYPH|nr:protein of unassigned function [Methylobacterium oryzae CBMB20]
MTHRGGRSGLAFTLPSPRRPATLDDGLTARIASCDLRPIDA